MGWAAYSQCCMFRERRNLVTAVSLEYRHSYTGHALEANGHITATTSVFSHLRI